MASSTVTFFDIPTREPQTCWSMNTWRTRLLLNYKGVDYETQWIEYPDIRPLLEPHVSQNEKGAPFTLPAVRLPDGSYAMDSYKIADLLEEKYPEPALTLNPPVLLRFRPILIAFMGALVPVYVPGVAQRILGEKSQDFFRTTRKEDLGMPLEEYAEKHGPESWDKAEPHAHEMTALLNETSGPYFLGDEISYVDFIWAGILLFFQAFGDDQFQELLKRSGGNGEAHLRLLNALSKWTERKD